MTIRSLLRSIPRALGLVSAQPIPAAMAKMNSAFDFDFRSLEGGDLALDQYRGKTVLVVNVASECGFTPQYRGLQKLWQDYRDRGLVILGVPSNDFGAQEPGSATEIQQFCELNYGVDFPLTEKVAVTGAGAHPLYKWFEFKLGDDGRPRWNFHKYLIAPDGQVVGGFSSRVAPDDAKLIKAIEAHLPAK
jgi:glutathione peroxidase